MTSKTDIPQAMQKFVAIRPGLEYGNYRCPKAYSAEMRGITRDLHDARALLAAVAINPDITGDDLADACKRAFSGRLSWDADAKALEYCAGQYFPTEYRKAVCAVLAQALLSDFRMKPNHSQNPRALVQAHFRKQFGRGIASRWFY